MEFEISDDPQGLPEPLYGDRDGGLSEDRIFRRKDTRARTEDRHEDAVEEDSTLQQLGEAA